MTDYCENILSILAKSLQEQGRANYGPLSFLIQPTETELILMF